MSGLDVRFFRTVVCLVVLLLCGQNSAWHHLPSDPDDQYYESFQNLSSLNDTARKLITNFLHSRYTSWYTLILNTFGRYHEMFQFNGDIPLDEDILVVMDGSGSVDKCDFDKGKKALRHMMGLADERGTDTKYAAVTFADSAQVNFKFKPYSTAANEILTIAYPTGGTNTQAGLAEAKKLFNDPLSGQRLVTRKKVFLVTDGQSNVHPDLTIPNAGKVKNIGVEIYVVAVGSRVNGIHELVKVASYPPEKFLLRVQTYQKFWEVIKLVIKQVSPVKYAIIKDQYDSPC